jgi:hypothetical protein
LSASPQATPDFSPSRKKPPHENGTGLQMGSFQKYDPLPIAECHTLLETGAADPGSFVMGLCSLIGDPMIRGTDLN